MPLKIIHDGTPEGELQERCCLCRTPTRYWHKKTDVALCPVCASKARLSDLSTKKEWCDKERQIFLKGEHNVTYKI